MKREIKVIKFGGTSLGSPERIQAVAKRIQAMKKNGFTPVVVVSAMAGETNRLIELTCRISKIPVGEEYDFILASGEQVAAGLLALSLREKGIASRPLMGWQAGIQTDSRSTKARIDKIDLGEVNRLLAADILPIVTGFQGVDSLGKITTLGRGGSDTSAVALAAAFSALGNPVVCEIFTDVDGVYTADPRLVQDACKLDQISYLEMLELTAAGSKVMHLRSIETGAKQCVPLKIRSSFNDHEGTEIMSDTIGFERGRVTAIASDAKVVLITISGLPNRPGVAYEIYGLLNDFEVVPEFLSQAEFDTGLAQIAFLVPEEDAPIVQKLFESRWALSFHDAEMSLNRDVARLTLVGLGLHQQTEIQKKALQVFSELKIDIRGMSHGEMKLGFIFTKKHLPLILNRLHFEFFGVRGTKSPQPEIGQKS